MSQTEQTSDVPFYPHRRQRSPAEWITFIAALSILATLVGLVLYSWLQVGKRPPTLEVEQNGEIREQNGQFYIPFKLTNTGGETADAVQVVAELEVNGEVEESGDLQFDFIAGGEEEEGAFIFRRNPQEGELNLRVSSYLVP